MSEAENFTLEEAWQHYEIQALPAERDGARLAFYAGAWLILMAELDLRSLSQARLKHTLDRVRSEADAVVHTVQRAGV